MLHPALYEGFGLPPLEAMATGTPVIAANTGSLPEVVGSAGVLCAPDDVDEWAAAIERITSDSDLRAALRQSGLTRAEQMTWDRTARRTVEVYQLVLG